jgi:hypothetical protein
MPRPRKVNPSSSGTTGSNKNNTSDNILKSDQLTDEILHAYDCVGGTIYLNELSPIERNIIATYYRFTLSDDGNGFIFKVKNSWKSIVHLLAAVFYIRQVQMGQPAAAYIIRHARIGLSAYLLMEKDYNYICSRSEEKEWENLHIPTGYAECYVKSKYRTKDILKSIEILSKELEVNLKKSVFQVAEKRKDTGQKPVAAVGKNPRSLSTYIETFKSVDYVDSKIMQNLIQGSMRLYVASPLMSPQEVKEWLAETQDVTYPYEFIAYPLLERYKSHLISYFPLQEDCISRISEHDGKGNLDLNKDDYYLHTGCGYLITDIKSLGRWN